MGWTTAALILKHLKLWNKGEWDLSWRWWPLTILGTNLLEVMNWGCVPTCKTEKEDDDEVVDYNTSGILSPMAPPLTVYFLPPWWASVLLYKWGLFTKLALLVSGTGLLCSLWTGFGLSHRMNRLRQVHGWLMLSQCQRPVYMTIKAGLRKRNHVL